MNIEDPRDWPVSNLPLTGRSAVCVGCHATIWQIPEAKAFSPNHTWGVPDPGCFGDVCHEGYDGHQPREDTVSYGAPDRLRTMLHELGVL